MVSKPSFSYNFSRSWLFFLHNIRYSQGVKVSNREDTIQYHGSLRSSELGQATARWVSKTNSEKFSCRTLRICYYQIFHMILLYFETPHSGSFFLLLGVLFLSFWWAIRIRVFFFQNKRFFKTITVQCAACSYLHTRTLVHLFTFKNHKTKNLLYVLIRNSCKRNKKLRNETCRQNIWMDSYISQNGFTIGFKM